MKKHDYQALTDAQKALVDEMTETDEPIEMTLFGPTLNGRDVHVTTLRSLLRRGVLVRVYILSREALASAQNKNGGDYAV